MGYFFFPNNSCYIVRYCINDVQMMYYYVGIFQTYFKPWD